MKCNHNNLFTIVVMLIVVCMAACSSNSPISTIEPSEMALQLNELPENFKIMSRSERTRSDVPSEAIDNGWKRGYQVKFIRLDMNKLEGTLIGQSISIYAVEKTHDILSLQYSSSKTFAEKNSAIMEDLSNPNIGDQSQAYRIKYDDKIIYKIDFIKKDVFEVLTLTGITTDYETLKQLAKKAAAKIK